MSQCVYIYIYKIRIHVCTCMWKISFLRTSSSSRLVSLRNEIMLSVVSTVQQKAMIPLSNIKPNPN